MDRVQLLLAQLPACTCRLIRDHDESEALVLEGAKGFPRPDVKHQILRCANEISLDI